jgi:ABC-type Fe3+/spermidine/putrescine transport system ATPase subunit
MSASFLKVVEVSKRFADENIIDGVSLEISEGEVVALLGPSGCGKTTLLRLIAGLETPEEGEIWIAGKRVSIRQRNIVSPPHRNVGFVFQDLALWPHLTVAGNLEFVLRSRGWEKHARRSRKYSDSFESNHWLSDIPANFLAANSKELQSLAR